MALRQKLMSLQTEFNTVKKVLREQSGIQMGESKHYIVDGEIARIEYYKNGDVAFSVLALEKL